MMKAIIKISVLFLVIILIIIYVPTLNGKYIKSSKLYINEVCASNQSIIQDDDLEYSDYIELYNGYSYDINLQGYHLSDSEFATSKWTFPDVTIKSNSYLIVYASKKDRFDDGYIHTNFKLSSDGEVLTLSTAEGNIISKISYPRMNPNTSYGYLDNDYYLMEPSPLIKNTNNISLNKEDNAFGNIIINEYITHNKRVNYDSNGIYYDWIELYNKSDSVVNLSNLYLSDNKDNLSKYMFSNVKINAKSYLLIYLAGEKKANSDNIYANFKLSEGEDIILSDGKKIYDMVHVINLKDNISYGLKEDKWYYFTTPTPGYVNNTAGFIKMGDDNGSS